jgi:hypothetical protein
MGTRVRVSIFATLLILILSASTDLQAQGRGGGARGGGMSRGMGGGRVAPSGTFAGRPGTQFAGRPVAPFVTSPVGPAVPPVVTPPNANIPRGVGQHRGFDRSFAGSRRNAFVNQPFFGGFGGFVPTYYYDPFSVYGAPSYVEPQYAAPPESNNNSELSYQVQQLSQQIEDLRAQEEAMAAARLQPPPPPPPSTPEPPPPPTTLLFRDGHRMSIQNYAVVGDMLLVLDNRNSLKIPLADLDLGATQKINRENGVRFSLGR